MIVPMTTGEKFDSIMARMDAAYASGDRDTIEAVYDDLHALNVEIGAA